MRWAAQSARSCFGGPAALILTTGVFAVLHLQYDRRGVLLVACDGVLFGLSGGRTGSVLLAMAFPPVGSERPLLPHMEAPGRRASRRLR